MKLQSIQAFLATVETGSIRAAARQLELSQPAISKTLKALEDELGAPLLVRGAKGIDLTEYGRAFLVRATTIWNESTKARDEIRQMRGERDGHVSLVLSPAAALQLAPVAVRQFRRKYPRVRVHLLEGLEPFAVDKLRTGEVEMAICPLYSELSPKEFVIKPLRDIRMVIAARRGHPLRDASSLEELQSADWVYVGAGGSLSPLIVTFYENCGLQPPDVAVECFSFTSSISMIRQTEMLGLVPDTWTTAPEFAAGFTSIDVAEGPLFNRLQLIYRRDRPLTPMAQKLAARFLRLADIRS